MKTTVRSLLLEALSYTQPDTAIPYTQLMELLYDHGYVGSDLGGHERGHGEMTYDYVLKRLLLAGSIKKPLRGLYNLSEPAVGSEDWNRSIFEAHLKLLKIQQAFTKRQLDGIEKSIKVCEKRLRSW